MQTEYLKEIRNKKYIKHFAIYRSKRHTSYGGIGETHYLWNKELERHYLWNKELERHYLWNKELERHTIYGIKNWRDTLSME